MKEETWISAGEMLCAKTWRRKDATQEMEGGELMPTRTAV